MAHPTVIQIHSNSTKRAIITVRAAKGVLWLTPNRSRARQTKAATKAMFTLKTETEKSVIPHTPI